MDMNLKVGIVGLGLIGGSIFKALCALNCKVYAVSKSSATIYQAKKYSHQVSETLEDLKTCDIIFVCTPMNKVNETLNKLEKFLDPSTIVSDVSSLKRFVSNKKRPYKFIPTHPMAGTEFSGFNNSFETLFQRTKWVLTPLEDTKTEDIKKITDIIETLGAEPIFSNPNEHDEAVGLISHMPMLIAQSLFKSAQHNKLALKLASSGFRDMTRLALSNEEMANDMINLNSDNIQTSLLNMYNSVGELLNKDYQEQIKQIKKERQSLYVDGKNVL